MRRVVFILIPVLVLLAVASALENLEPVADSGVPVADTVSARKAAAVEGKVAVAETDKTSPSAGTASPIIDGRGSLDIEQWIRIMPADGKCAGVMWPDVTSVIDVLLHRYQQGEIEAAVLLAAAYGCEYFHDQPDYQRERMNYWGREAARHDLAWGYRIVGTDLINRMMGYHPGVPKPGLIEMEGLRQSWHDAAVRAYELTGDPEDARVLAFSYAHTFGAVFDEDRAKYWLDEWARVASPDKVANVGRQLIGRGLGGYRNGALGAGFLLRAARAGHSGSYLELLEFIASCEGAAPANGLPSARSVHEELAAAEGVSVAAAIALASALARAGDFIGAYEALVDAQFVQQAVDPDDIDSLQTLARLAERVRSGNVIHLRGAGEHACNPRSTFPEEH